MNIDILSWLDCPPVKCCSTDLLKICFKHHLQPFQKVKQVFPVAEELKEKLKAKYTVIEKKRQEEEVCIHLGNSLENSK